jgi:hypothetical protein
MTEIKESGLITGKLWIWKCTQNWISFFLEAD